MFISYKKKKRFFSLSKQEFVCESHNLFPLGKLLQVFEQEIVTPAEIRRIGRMRELNSWIFALDCLIGTRNLLLSISSSNHEVAYYRWLSNTNLMAELIKTVTEVNWQMPGDRSSIIFLVKRREIQKSTYLLTYPRIYCLHIILTLYIDRLTNNGKYI